MKYPHTYILIPYTADRRGRLFETLASIWAHTDTELTPHSVVLYENNYIGYPNAILDMVSGIDGFVFMGASDLIHGKDWLKILWEEMDKHKRVAVVEPFNEFWKGAMVQHALLPAVLLRCYFHRHYFHYYADNEMHERCVADGLYYYCPEAPMQHNHVLNGKAPMDEGYKIVLDPAKNEKDRLMYEYRKANNWPS